MWRQRPTVSDVAGAIAIWQDLTGPEKRFDGETTKQKLLEVIDPPTLFDEHGKLLPASSPVFKDISKALNAAGRKMSPKYVWVFISNDRHGILRCLRGEENVDMDDELGKGEEESEVVLPSRDFSIIIDAESWDEMKPVSRRRERADRPGMLRTVLSLPPFGWTHILARLMWEQHQLPCSMVFRRSRVNTTPSVSSKYVVIEDGQCPECNGVASGYINTEPEAGHAVELRLRCTDTRGLAHDKKRQCRGREREQIGNDIQGKSTQEYRRNDSKGKVSEKGISAPNIYSDEVLRKIRQEKLRQKLSALRIPLSTNPFEALGEMKYCHPFLGSVHFISIDPVIVMYHTPEQLLINNELCKSYCKQSIDASGSLVKNSRGDGLSGHIFLTQVVGNVKGETIPLNQMLSERQDANITQYWLNEDIRKRFSTPNEFVCDHSGALPNALARSVAGCASLKDYSAQCFDVLLGKSSTLPRCYIRVDVAHVINNATKWKLWKSVENTMVKQHLLRWYALLVKADSFQDFKNILGHLLVVAKAKPLGKNAAETSKKILVSKVADQADESDVDMDDVTELDNEDVDDNDENDDETPESVQSFLHELQKNSDDSALDKGKGLNPYFSPAFAEKVLKKASNFMLWSSVMARHFKSPFPRGSSSNSEEYFGYLKGRAFQQFELPMKLHQFVGIHVHSLLGHVNLASVNLLSNFEDLKSETKHDNQTSTKSSRKELDEAENWRGKSTPRKQSKYLTPHPEIAVETEALAGAITGKPLKTPQNMLLKNGNLTGFYALSKDTKVQVGNTCGFDAYIPILAAAMVDRPTLRSFIEELKEDSQVLQVASSLVNQGASSATYAVRAEALVKAAALCNANQKSSDRNDMKSRRRTTSILTYSVYGNASVLLGNPQLPLHMFSKETIWKCRAGHQENTHERLLQVVEGYVSANGIQKLQEAAVLHLRSEGKDCRSEGCRNKAKALSILGKVVTVDINMSF
ncbi:hypothetical protein ONE63_011530 [Megalurothrips usitatus]|uniref:Uncharacterized protein n=1 Tax=Megalurothrips usitatus TaxID=439358 RepID=A0AAV7X343_9NEOP|nr:hypothetical protein ONE63_011530 [Megalurothrips usitatus]